MKKKGFKYFVLIVVAGLLAYNSVYFKKLDAQKTQLNTALSPVDYAQKFWTRQFIAYLDSAVEINSFIKMLKDDPTKTFQQYAHTQGIGNISFFLLKGEGTIQSVDENEVVVLAKAGTDELAVKLITGLYFGNAVRDVTGHIKMDDFSNTREFNIVSSELNKIVSKQVMVPFKAKAVKGASVQFVGCAEINKEQINTASFQLLPVRINFSK